MRVRLLSGVAALATVLSAQEPLTDEVAAWQKDLDLLVQCVPEMHPNWFEYQTEEAWKKAVARARLALPDLSVPGRVLAMCELLASGGDAHTAYSWAHARIPYCPIGLAHFRDGVLIVAADESLSALVGLELVAIEGLPVADVVDRLASVISHDNRRGLARTATHFMVRPAFLNSLGLSERVDRLQVTVAETDGRHTEHELEIARGPVEWTGMDRPTPLCEERADQNCWWRYVADRKLLYFKYNRCREPLAFLGVVEQMWREMRDEEIERFVIDFRDNGGGSSLQFRGLLGRVARSEWNRRGVLFGIIGTATFSSAVLNAMELSHETEAVLVGSPTAGRPNHFGEIRQIELPNVGVPAWCSTKRFRKVDGDPDSFEPDVIVELTMADYRAGRDPVLQAVLDWKDGG